MKNNLSYYRHEVTSDDHWKFKMLRVLFEQEFGIDGWAAEGRFWALNNRIAKSDDCHLNYTDEIQKLADAADFKFSLEQYDKFLDILINKCRLVKVAADGTYYTDHTQMVYSGVQEDRENARNRKQNSRSKNTIDEKKSQPTKDVSQVTMNLSHSSHTGQQDSSPVTDIQSKVKYSKVKNTNTIPDSDESVPDEKIMDVVGVVDSSQEISELAQKSKVRSNGAAPKKSKPGSEPFQKMYMAVFADEWKQLRETDFEFDEKDYAAINRISKFIRKNHDPWDIETATEEFKMFLCNSKKDSFISKNNFENFTLPQILGRKNSVKSANVNQNGKQGTGSYSPVVTGNKPKSTSDSKTEALGKWGIKIPGSGGGEKNNP